jgi:phage gp46-like protein
MKFLVTDNGFIDLALGAAGLLTEETLESAVLVSLLTDRRALADDRLPDDTTATGLLPPDRRGWCGDALADDADDRIGSRLWLLKREKQTPETRRRAIHYATEALQWLIEDGHVSTVAVDAVWTDRGRLRVLITIPLPDGGTYSKSLEIGGAYAL